MSTNKINNEPEVGYDLAAEVQRRVADAPPFTDEQAALIRATYEAVLS